jgi:dihydrofolate reductase
MRKLLVFESVSLNGYFSGPGGDLDWAHAAGADPEFQEFIKGNAADPGVLLFGRVTYEMMVAYWPSAEAAKNDPAVAKGMNQAEKIVFSRTLDRVDWANARLVKDDPVATVRKLKGEKGKDLVVMGSGSIVTQLARAGLVDALQLVVTPVALGRGKTLLEGVEGELWLELTGSRRFKNGSVVLDYVARKK